MTTHVVCLDGTGQTRTQANPTNISLMFDTMGGTIVDAENNSFEVDIDLQQRLSSGGQISGRRRH